MQFERQSYTVLVPAPAHGEIGDDRGHAVLLHVLVVHDEVVEHPHDWPQRVDRHLLVDRQAGWAVDRIGSEDAAVFLGHRRSAERDERRAKRRPCVD